jgi:DNA-binding response OmpR family regulator
MVEQHTILLVEDDATIREMTQLSLERDGFVVATAADGPAGLEAFRAGSPDLVLLDVMLPGLDGVSVCRAIRESSVKPFEPSVLAARLRAVLRRVTRAAPQQPLRFGDLEIDPLGMVVTRGGEELSLTPTEYRLLLMLAENAGVVLGRERLLEEVWGYVWAGDTRLVDMHVRRLRGKVGPEVIETVRGAGYKMVRP